MGDEEQALRDYVLRKLRAHINPQDLLAELVRHKVPEPRAYALILQGYSDMKAENEKRWATASLVVPIDWNPLTEMEHQEIVEYIAMQLASGYDALNLFHQFQDYGCTEEEARKLLAEAGASIPETPSLPRAAPPAPGAEKGRIHSLYRRIPVSLANAQGRLSKKQRELLSRRFWRNIGLLIAAFIVEVAALFYAFLLLYGVSGSLTRLLRTIIWSYYSWPILAFIPICLMGIVFLSIDLVRHAGDLFPGHVRKIRTYLRAPAHSGKAGKMSYTVSLGRSRKRYRLWTADLYLLIGRWDLQRPYQVYCSPRTRWIWHLEPEEVQRA